MIKNIIILMIALLIMPLAFAVDLNQSIPIFADYKVDGILSSANARISIIDNDGYFEIDNTSMTELSKGRFNYNYTCNDTTKYKAIAVFYDKSSNAIKGSTESDFTCSNVNGWEIGSCPTSDLGIITFWIFVFLMLIMAFVGIAFKYSSLVVFAGVVFFILPFISGFCYEFVSYVELMLGLVFIGVGFNIRT